jgi:hypothetical protein
MIVLNRRRDSSDDSSEESERKKKKAKKERKEKKVSPIRHFTLPITCEYSFMFRLAFPAVINNTTH